MVSVAKMPKSVGISGGAGGSAGSARPKGPHCFKKSGGPHCLTQKKLNGNIIIFKAKE